MPRNDPTETDQPTSPAWPAGRRLRPAAGSGCAVCAVSQPLTFHHLIPRRCHRKSWFRDAFGLAEMRSRGAWLCRGCHDFIHDHFDEATLGRRLNTVEALCAEPLVQRHIGWASRQRVRVR